MAFSYPEQFNPVWTPLLPELSCAANAVSLLMPYAEPFVARSIANVNDQLPEPLAELADQYVRQETLHHKEHYRFNKILLGQVRGLTPITKAAAWSYGRLGHRSEQFGVAFAAGFETVAFAAARWVDQRASSLFLAAEEEPAGLFLWHLAEEAEHKTVAFDVMKAVGVGRVRYAFAMLCSAAMLAVFAVPAILVLLVNARRILNPIAHLRLAWWTLTFLSELIPDMLFSLRRSHNPADLVDPQFLGAWLARYDLETLETNSGLSENPSITSPRDNPESNRAVQ